MRKSRVNRLVSVGLFIVSAVCVTTQLQFKSVSAEKQFTEPDPAQVIRAIPAPDAEEPSLLLAIQDELTFDTNRLTVDANATFGQEAKLIAPDGAGGDEFGSTVAISGNTAVVGSSFADVDGKADQGVAYVFVRSGSVWSLQQKLIASDGLAGDRFGFSVAIEGNTLIVGAVVDDEPTFGEGSAYIFVRSGTTWTEQAKLVASDREAADQFGQSVAISGNTVVIGALRDNGPETGDQGSAYVFVRSGITWTEQAKLVASDGDNNDLMGASIGISGNTVVVSATRKEAAYVYVRSGTTWSQQQKLTASDAMAVDFFATSVAIDGERIVVGASQDDESGGIDQGSAYVFERSGTTWTERQKITASDATASAKFGASVWIRGPRLLVGANGENLSRGATYVFDLIGSTWVEQQKLIASDQAQNDLFGNDTGLSEDGSTVLVGSLRSDISGVFNQGAAYVFRLCPSISAVLSGSTTICSGSSGSVSVAVTGGVAPYTITLSNGGGTLTANSPLSFSVNPTTDTTYTIQSAVDASGCPITTSGSAVITVLPGATVDAGTDITVCASTPSVQLNGSFGGAATSAAWTGGTGTFIPNRSAVNATYVPSWSEIMAESVTLTLTADNPNASCTDPFDLVTIFFATPAMIDIASLQPVCATSPAAQLVGSVGGGASTGTWSGGTGTFSPNANALIVVYTPSPQEIAQGSVTLTLTTDDPAGPCDAASLSVILTIVQPPSVQAGPDQSVCAGTESIQLNGSLNGVSQATWTGGAGTFSPNATTLNATYFPTSSEMESGSVTLTLVSGDPAGPCTAVSDNVTISFVDCVERSVVYVPDTLNNRIQLFDGQQWSVVAGGVVGSGNGQFRSPEAVAVSASRLKLYVADTGNNRIQWSTDGGATWADFATVGNAPNQVRAPEGLALDALGNLYVSDTGNGRVLRFNSGVPGMGVVISSNGQGSGQIVSPRGMTIDSEFTLYVVDEANSRILKITNANLVTISTTGTILSAKGVGLNHVQNPQGIAVDSFGNLYIADTGNSRILKFPNGNPANGVALALTGTQLGQVNRPEGVTVCRFTSGPQAGAQFLVIGDTLNHRIQGRLVSGGPWSLVGLPNGVGTTVGRFRGPSKIR